MPLLLWQDALFFHKNVAVTEECQNSTWHFLGRFFSGARVGPPFNLPSTYMMRNPHDWQEEKHILNKILRSNDVKGWRHPRRHVATSPFRPVHMASAHLLVHKNMWIGECRKHYAIKSLFTLNHTKWVLSSHYQWPFIWSRLLWPLCQYVWLLLSEAFSVFKNIAAILKI